MYVDNNVGGLVKDAFLIAQPVSVVTDKMREIADPDTTLEPVDAADARAVMEEAIRIGEITIPPFETDTWPMCRPLVRWLVGKLPAGGVVHREEWSDDEQATLLERVPRLAVRRGVRRSRPPRPPRRPGLVRRLAGHR